MIKGRGTVETLVKAELSFLKPKKGKGTWRERLGEGEELFNGSFVAEIRALETSRLGGRLPGRG